MLADLKKSGDTSLALQDEKFVLIVDLLLFSPQLELEVIRFVLTNDEVNVALSYFFRPGFTFELLLFVQDVLTNFI